VETPPFEVEEAGWGEFEIVITLYFVDPSENAIDLFHPLKVCRTATNNERNIFVLNFTCLQLFPPEGVPHPPNKPVISENFDQIVFAEPTEAFYEILMANPPPAASGPDVTKYDSRTDDVQEAADIAKIAEAQRKVREELWRLKEKYDALQRDVSTAQKQASRGPSMAKS
jgi:YEATS domain-containing protein 4